MSGPLASGMIIGRVHLKDFEIPDIVRWGTKQLIKEHVFPGGQNDLQAMGPTREPISWSGQMIGPDATDRARLLDGLAASGAITPVAWGDLNFDVVVESFRADYKHQWWTGRYEVVCRVQWDYAQPNNTPNAAAACSNDLNSALSGISNGIASVTSTATGILQNAQTALSAVAGAVGPISAAFGISIPYLSNAQFALSSAQGLVNGVASAGTAVSGLSNVALSVSGSLNSIGLGAQSVGSIISRLGIVTPNNLIGATAACGALANLTTAFAYTSRSIINLANVPGISSPMFTPTTVRQDLPTQYPGA